MPNYNDDTITFNCSKNTYQAVHDLLTKPGIDYQEGLLSRQDLTEVNKIADAALFIKHNFDTKYGFYDTQIAYPLSMFKNEKTWQKFVNIKGVKHFDKPKYAIVIKQVFGENFNPQLSKIKAPDTNQIDFNNLIPEPAETILSGILNGNEVKHNKKVSKLIDSTDGSPMNWYEWNSYNWGTKWNAFDCVFAYDEKTKQATIAYTTAWSSPKPVLIELSRHFPDIEFYVHSDTEGVGESDHTYSNGKID